jgi:uncharacterized SAM-binding protein YcdF (DUF218 family)
MGVLGLLFIAQLLFWHLIGYSPNSDRDTDCIVVFNGSQDRVAQGFALVNRGYAECLIISPAGEQNLEVYRQHYSKVKNTRFLREKKARSTFENAYYSSRVIRRNGLKDVVLVTHDFHMARSYLLLKWMLIGSGVKVHPFKVPVAKGGNTVGAVLNIEKRLFNETLQFWGSLLEGFSIACTGQIPSKSHKDCGWIKRIKEIILF